MTPSLGLVKVTASTTTRSKIRCSGDRMGDQIAPGDQIGDQIFDMTKMWKSGCPIWSPGAIWSSNEACFSSDLFKRPWYLPKRQQLIANLVSNLVAQERSGHLEQSGRPGAIWSPIRLPEHLVVDLVLVDAFSLSTDSKFKNHCSTYTIVQSTQLLDVSHSSSPRCGSDWSREWVCICWTGVDKSYLRRLRAQRNSQVHIYLCF